MAVYELIHNFVEVLDKYFSRVVSETESVMKHFFFQNFDESVISENKSKEKNI